MSTPTFDIRPGTRIWGQAATGAPTYGFLHAKGTNAGTFKILLFAIADGAISVVDNAAYKRDDEPLPTGSAAFKVVGFNS